MAKSTAKRTTSSKKSATKSVKINNWRSPQAILIALVLILGIGGAGVWMLRSSSAASTATNIDTYKRDTVNSYYKSMWANNANVTSGWTGAVSGCRAGNPSSAARLAQVNAVNFARRMAGLTPVAAANLTDSVQANVQKAALMMEANNSLDHTPPTTWKCYTKAGATAAGKSNLGLYASGKPLEVIKSYFSDPGSGNYAAGHRRWLLYPDAAVFAFGTTAKGSAVQVLGLRTNSDNNNPRYVPWPTDGYFPNAIEPGGRWSLSGRQNACFNSATVSATYNNSTTKLSGISLLSRKANYGHPAIVWQMPSGFAKTGLYRITVSNINQKTTSGACSTSSATRTSYTYPVNLFTPY